MTNSSAGSDQPANSSEPSQSGEDSIRAEEQASDSTREEMPASDSNPQENQQAVFSGPDDPEALRKFDEEADASNSASSGTGFVRIIKMVAPIVEKTTLDLDACREVVGRLLSDQEVRVTEEVKERQKQAASMPVKPPNPITSYRNATPCGAKWDSMSGTDQFRFCDPCKKFVYDFKDLELAEAEHLVFQREAIKNPKYYKRKDGRFLTCDCPVGLARGKQLAFTVLAVLLVIGVAIALAMSAPKTEAPAPAVTETQPPPVQMPAENRDGAVGFSKSDATLNPNEQPVIPSYGDTPAAEPATPDASTAAPPTPAVPPTAPPGGWPAQTAPAPGSFPKINAPAADEPARKMTPEEWAKVRQESFQGQVPASEPAPGGQ